MIANLLADGKGSLPQSPSVQAVRGESFSAEYSNGVSSPYRCPKIQRPDAKGVALS